MPKLKSKEFIIKYQLLRWYKNNARILPWRNIQKKNLPNLYYILISEFMLQQTTVSTVIKRFDEFVNLWPNIKKLSQAKENQILRFWSGLGYYIRAKNLLKSAKVISFKFKNIIPNNYEDLISLPGIGDYTAKAILGIGYNMPFMPIDANIERIIARLNGIKKPIISAKKDIAIIADLYVSKNHSSSLIQAFMDYGSIVCLPRNPNCSLCVISKNCVAKQKKLTGAIPNKKKSNAPKRKKFTRAYVIVNNKNEVLVRRRPPNGMLPSMLELPNDKWVVEKKLLEKDKITKYFKKKLIRYESITYSFSHFNLEVDIFLTHESKIKLKDHHWILLSKISNSEIPTIMKKILAVVKLIDG